MNLVSQDKRRKLYEWGQGSWVFAKYLDILSDSIVGDHFHKEKDECFLLVKGRMTATIGDKESFILAPAEINIPAGTYHKFELRAGSILIGLASKQHDPNDDHKL